MHDFDPLSFQAECVPLRDRIQMLISPSAHALPIIVPTVSIAGHTMTICSSFASVSRVSRRRKQPYDHTSSLPGDLNRQTTVLPRRKESELNHGPAQHRTSPVKSPHIIHSTKYGKPSWQGYRCLGAEQERGFLYRLPLFRSPHYTWRGRNRGCFSMWW